jgi:hypothetical protein
VAVQSVGGNDAALERQKLQHFQSASRFVATRCFLLSQRHARFHRKHVDQLQRRSSSTALVRAAQSLAVDRHDPRKLEPVGFRKSRHETAEGSLERLRLEQTKHATECVVARDAVFQPKKEPQGPFLRLTKVRHVRARFRPTHHCCQRNEQRFQQIVSGVLRPWVRQSPKCLSELVHPTPSMTRESLSESFLPSNAIDPANPYAIPLPLKGRVKKGAAPPKSTTALCASCAGATALSSPSTPCCAGLRGTACWRTDRAPSASAGCVRRRCCAGSRRCRRRSSRRARRRAPRR